MEFHSARDAERAVQAVHGVVLLGPRRFFRRLAAAAMRSCISFCFVEGAEWFGARWPAGPRSSAPLALTMEHSFSKKSKVKIMEARPPERYPRLKR